MRIRIRTSDVKLNFRIPTFMLTSPLGFRFVLRQSAKKRWQPMDISKYTNGEGEHLVVTKAKPGCQKIPSRSDLRKLRGAIKKIKKQYRKFPLVEVETADGDTVKIIL